MVERISTVHLKQFVGELIEGEEVKEAVLQLLEQYIETVKSDKRELVEGLQALMESPIYAKPHAELLIEKFGPMPELALRLK